MGYAVEKRAKILEMYRDNVPTEEIAAFAGKSARAIVRLASYYGVKRPDGKCKAEAGKKLQRRYIIAYDDGHIEVISGQKNVASKLGLSSPYLSCRLGTRIRSRECTVYPWTMEREESYKRYRRHTTDCMDWPYPFVKPVYEEDDEEDKGE